MRRSKLRRAGSIAATYLLVAALAVLGWLWHSLPAEILLEPGQTLTLPRFAYVQPLQMCIRDSCMAKAAKNAARHKPMRCLRVICRLRCCKACRLLSFGNDLLYHALGRIGKVCMFFSCLNRAIVVRCL